MSEGTGVLEDSVNCCELCYDVVERPNIVPDPVFTYLDIYKEMTSLHEFP